MAKIVTLLGLLVVMALCGGTAYAVQDATQEWDSVAGTYSFTSTMLASPGATFEDAYYGCPCDFAVNFAGIKAAVAELMRTTVPPATGEDLMIATLQNWPDS